MTEVSGREAVVEASIRAVLAPSVVGGNHHPGVSLLEVDGASGDVRDVHLGYLGILSLAHTRTVHAHQEDMFRAGGFVHVVDVHEVRVQAVGCLGGIVHHVACVFHGLVVVVVHIERHVRILRNVVFLGGSQIQVADCRQGIGSYPVRTSGDGNLVHSGKLNCLVQVCENLVPDFVQILGGAYRSFLKFADGRKVHGHAAEVPCQVEVRVSPHEIGLSHILVADVLVKLIHGAYVLYHRVGPVDGNVGVFVEVVEGCIGLEGCRFPTVQLLG